MPTHLDSIVASVRKAEAEALRTVSLDELLQTARQHRATPAGAVRSLRAALQAAPEQPAIIAEIKRASPSRGDLDPGLDAARQARAYRDGGAVAISVLTEPAFFKGRVEDLRQARAAVDLPVLRKDFILSEAAVAASAAMGADALLLIVRLLEPDALARLYQLASELGLECLCEVHDETDLERIAELQPPLVGINNRDLASFATDPGRAARLAVHLPAQTTVIALSGITTPAELAAAGRSGIRCFLIGEALVRAPDSAARLAELRAAWN